MMTTANYLLIAYVGGEQYHFEYECGDMWEALQEFFFDDYPETLIDIDKAGEFPIDVLAMDGGKAIRRYEVAFHSVLFDHFFGKGHTVDSIYTLDEFGKDIKDVRSRLDAEKKSNPDPRQMKALMDRWAHFCYSHPPYDEVILWMVGGSKQHYLYQHFCSKFLHLCSVCHEDTMSAWIKFYRELDDQWAERLMEYVYFEWKN